MGFALLFALSALAAFAALAVVVRAEPRGRAEALVAGTLMWTTLIVAPIYVLGLAHRLWPRTVAGGVLLASLTAFALASRGAGPAALARRTLALAGGIARLPFEALALSFRVRSFIFLGVAFAAILVPYLAVVSYFGQPLPKWDPLWYHDTIVGFTLQNHSFEMVDLPDTLQKVNGYVRLCEMTQLWLVIFTDRRLADLANILYVPCIAAATYAMARRYSGRLTSIGWGVAVILMPACAQYMHGTYVDVENAGLVLGGILFATIDRPRLRDGALAALGLALAIGSKGLALVSAPIAAIVGAVLLLRAHWHGRRRAAIGVLVGGAVLIVGTASITYVRNYLAFHNPLWPDMRVEIPSLGIHWPGMGPWAGEAGGTPVNLNESLPRLLDHLYALPWSIKGMYFDQAVEYGIGIVWIAVPLGALAFLTTLVIAWQRRFLRGAGRLAEAAPPLAIALILAVMIAGSPALWGPRYHTPHVGLLVVLVAWFTHRLAWQRLEEPAVAGVLITSLMMFWWTPDPSYYTSPKRLVALMQAKPLEREVDRDLGAPTIKEVGLAREKELTAGTLLVFNDHYAGYPSLFWNEHFSNRIKYIRGSGAAFLDRAAKEGATWVFVAATEPTTLAAARAPGSGWQEVGELNPWIPGYAFRRVTKPAEPPKAPPAKTSPAAAPPQPKLAPPAPPQPKLAPPKTAPPAPGRPAEPSRRATARPRGDK